MLRIWFLLVSKDEATGLLQKEVLGNADQIRWISWNSLAEGIAEDHLRLWQSIEKWEKQMWHFYCGFCEKKKKKMTAAYLLFLHFFFFLNLFTSFVKLEL